MSVAIVAQFPWRGVRILGEVIDPFCLIFTDTRVTAGGQALRPDLPKQFCLSKNLIACYTSSNVYALTEALFETATAMNLACAFSQAVEEVKDPSVHLPIQITAVTKEGIFERKASIFRKASRQLEPLTTNEKQLGLPAIPAKIPTFAGKKRSAIQLVEGCTPSNKKRKPLDVGER